MGNFLYGAKVAEALREETRVEVAALSEQHGIVPKLVAILVGDNPASRTYVGAKRRACEAVGISSETVQLANDITTQTLLEVVQNLNRDPVADAILVQLPIPSHVDKVAVLNAVDPAKDVDGFHPVNVGRTCINSAGVAPCTPAGIVELLKRSRVRIAGARAVIVGRSDIVGKPLALLLLHEHATVTVCHSKTKDLHKQTQRADILVGAMGKTAFLRGKHIRKGAVVVDVGVNRVDSRKEILKLFGRQGKESRERLKRFDERGYVLVGDVHPREGKAKARAITPVPGGVGPLTVAMLVRNTLSLAKARRGPEQAAAAGR
jgi:methylenetetrahydrofolate dehydrogenase (NADP+)/methenyltetrahydrofolate cyclohydrolase